MNEEQWLVCPDPEPLLEFVRGKVSDRKWRLFAVACCRRLAFGAGANEETARRLLELVERYADGQATREELGAASAEIDARSDCGYWAVLAAAGPEAASGADSAAQLVATCAAEQAWAEAGTPEGDLTSYTEGVTSERGLLARVLRDIVGNPFRQVRVDLEWGRCNEGRVRRMAQAIYQERAFERLPILADALEEAGCDDPVILDHCRKPGTHARGCWVVDVLLGHN